MSNMKQTFADTLMEMLNTTSLENISIKDVVSRCGVSRQSFYYYFNDIYDIVEWIFLQETEKALNEYSDINNWQFGYVLLMKWVQNHKALVLNTYKSVQREYIEHFMNQVLYQYIIKVVEDQSQGMNVTTDQCEFIAKFFTLAINAISLEWIRTGMKERPENVAEQVNTVIKGDFKKALSNFQMENQK